MPEHLRALVVILAIAAMTLLVARPAFAGAMDRDDFSRRWGVWVSLTLVAFLAHNQWIYLAVSMVVLYVAQRREHNVVALFFVALFALPPFRLEVPGFGIVNFLIDLNHARLLSLVLLLPAWLRLRAQSRTLPFGRNLPDKLLLAFAVLTVVLELRATSVTDTLRQGFYVCTDVFLPYYVTSRALRDLRTMREAMAGFVIAAMILGGVALVEYLKGWLLYSSLPAALGVAREMGGYLPRGTSLRALASTGQPIVLGYVMVVALGFFLFVKGSVTRVTHHRMILAFLLVGLLASLSRGPWVGAVVLMLAFLSLGTRPLQSLVKFFAVGALVILAAITLPGGAKVIDLLPFVGTVDSANVTYRERLLDNALIVIERNPLLGSVDYLESTEMQAMLQGQGIIDVVNSYLGVALEYGLAGLGLFVAFFLVIVLSVHRKLRSLAHEHHGERVLGAVLLSTLIGILVMIYTVSSIVAIPIVYWAVAGLGVAYARTTASRHEPVNARQYLGAET